MKLTFILAMTFAVTGIVFYMGVSTMEQINRKLNNIVDVAAKKITLTSGIEHKAVRISGALRNAILANDQSEIGEYTGFIEKHEAAIRKQREELYELTDKAGREILDKFADSRKKYAKVYGKILALARENSDEEAFKLGTQGRSLMEQAVKLMGQIRLKNRKDMDLDKQESDEQYASARNRMITVTLTGIFLATCFGLYSIRSITVSFRTLFRGMKLLSENELGETSEKLGMIVETISGNQIAASSQSLAQGASEQASAIEETSSSLEQMTSMIKLNADNANHADGLMRETISIVESANQSMNNLTDSMEEISRASRETFKIIKTIDEIAFQTNLLALNAAVEAARAGEAGAGFAVVADEVRNLALRSAEAARNTSAMIENTIRKINEGAELVSKTNEAFRQVAESAAKVGELLAEIAGASNEQAMGITQVSKATFEMDKIVQQNAASAQELSAQAHQLDDIVSELLNITTGRDKETKSSELPDIITGRDKKTEISEPDITGGDKKTETGRHGTDPKNISVTEKERRDVFAMRHTKDEINPELLIPLDDNDFEDF